MSSFAAELGTSFTTSTLTEHRPDIGYELDNIWIVAGNGIHEQIEECQVRQTQDRRRIRDLVKCGGRNRYTNRYRARKSGRRTPTPTAEALTFSSVTPMTGVGLEPTTYGLKGTP